MHSFFHNPTFGFSGITGWLTGHSLKIVIASCVIVFGTIAAQKACDASNQQTEKNRLVALETERIERQAMFQANLTKANADHETTIAILDTITQMTANINILAENDTRISKRVDDIFKNDYTAARSQKQGQPTIAERRRPNRNLKQREDDILALDKQLFP